MKQSVSWSIVEAWINVSVGFGIAVVGNYLVLPIFGLHPSWADATGAAVVFTGLSLIRSFTLRRIFEEIRVRVESGAISWLK